VGTGILAIAARFLVASIVALFWAGTALAENRVAADKRVALVVGNGQYVHFSDKLPNPANDAHDLAEALREIGFAVILRTDIGKANFDQALAEFARKAKNADTALVYYAGHGIQRGGKNYFLPTDIDNPDEFELNYLAINQDGILDAVSQAKSVKIVILDACRNNPLAKQRVASRSLGESGLARIESAEETIIAYATTPGHIAYDGAGRNSPFATALIKHIKEPGLEIELMFKSVASDVYEETKGFPKGPQHPEYSSSLVTKYILNTGESDSDVWRRIRKSDNAEDFKEFIHKFPTSPFVLEAQDRIDTFERIRRENEEARQEAERRQREADRLREAKLRDEELKRREDERRVAIEAETKHKDEEARKEAEREREDEQRKVAALEQEEHKKQLEREQQAQICESDQRKLEEFAAGLRAAEIEQLAKDTACPSLQPAVAAARKKLAREMKQICEQERKTLAALKDGDIESLKASAGQMKCEAARAEGKERIAKLELENKRIQFCKDETAKLRAIDDSTPQARSEYAGYVRDSACPSLREEAKLLDKKIESRIKEAQSKLAALGCYKGAVTGRFDDATMNSLALYHSKKGRKETGDHLSDAVLSDLKAQELIVCPGAVIATPTPEPQPQIKEQANKEEEARPEPKPPRQPKHAAHEEEAPTPTPQRHRKHVAPPEEEPAPPPKPRSHKAVHAEEPAPPHHHKVTAPPTKPHPTAKVWRPPVILGPSASHASPSVIGVGN
jgi:uncharacterized caspase-like protein